MIKRFSWFITEMSVSQVHVLSQKLDKMFAPFGVEVIFTRHVTNDRLLTGQREGGVTADEIIGVFQRFIARYKDRFGKKEWEAVIKDVRTKLNLPVIYKKDALEGDFDMIIKSIMKKRDFRSSGKVLTVK